MENKGDPGKMYPCKLCDQVFVSAQALGGHQNSHRHEREIMKKARENGDRLFMLAPPQSKPLSTPTMPMYIPNFRNQQNSLTGSSHFHGPTHIPNRMVPKEYYFQPFVHQQQKHAMYNCYFGPRNHYNNPSGIPVGSANMLSGHHVGFPNYYEGIPRQEKPHLEPQIYDFFGSEIRGMPRIANELDTTLSACAIEENKMKDGDNVAGPSTSLVMIQSSDKATLNKVGNDKTNTELDLALRL